MISKEHITFCYKCGKHFIEKCYKKYLVNSDPSHLVENVKCIFATEIEESRSPQHLMLRSEVLLQETSSFTHFKQFVHQMAEKDKV